LSLSLLDPVAVLGRRCHRHRLDTLEEELANAEEQLAGLTARWQAESSTGPHEAKLLTLSSTQAHTHLGWHPTWDADAATARTVAWYRAFYDGADVAHLTQSQIHDHETASFAEQCHEHPNQAQAKPAA
jgi:hypothetical protein